MQIKAILGEDGRVQSYATVGDIEGSVTVEIPDDGTPTDYRIVSNQAVYDPVSPPPAPATMQERMSDVETVLAMLAYGGENL